MSTDGLGTLWRRNIAENFNRLSRVHQRYRQTDDRQTTDGRTTTYSEHELEFTFAKNIKNTCDYDGRKINKKVRVDIISTRSRWLQDCLPIVTDATSDWRGGVGPSISRKGTLSPHPVPLWPLFSLGAYLKRGRTAPLQTRQIGLYRPTQSPMFDTSQLEAFCDAWKALDSLLPTPLGKLKTSP